MHFYGSVNTLTGEIYGACGRKANIITKNVEWWTGWTTERKKVTCGACKRTRLYKKTESKEK